MSMVDTSPPPDFPGDPLPNQAEKPRGRPWLTGLAWVVILGAVAYLVFRPSRTADEQGVQQDLLMFRMQARYMIGASRFVGGKQLLEQAEDMNRGNYAQRLRYVIVAGELGGLEDGSAALDELRGYADLGLVEPNEKQERISDILERALVDAASWQDVPGLLTDEEKQALLDLGYFGELLHPDRRPAALAQASRTFVVVLAGVIGFLLAAAVGFLVVLLLIILRLVGRLRPRWNPQGSGGVFAETFALWIMLYVGMGFLFLFLPRPPFPLLTTGLIMLLSVAGALLWPRLRGYSWQEIRAETGLTRGSNPWIEALWGGVCYLAALPVLIIGVLIMFAMMWLARKYAPAGDPFGPSGQPGHPIIFDVVGGNWVIWLQVYFAAAIVAPLAEETVFRGLLYRQLRGAVGIILAMIVVSFLFAVIHPQGWFGIPPLMGLALVFNFFREWRGSLIAPMVAHGINNAAVLTFLILAAA